MDKVLQNERRDIIVMEIDSYLNQKSQYGDKMGNLNESQITFLIIENLEREINNGGFNQFYWNSSGDYANETAEALEKIGAKKTAGIVKKANSEFNNGIVPQDKDKRYAALEKIEEKARENWKNCNAQFYKYEDNITELLIAFVLNNHADFEK
ncbi:DMP19 family protein [Ulvibacterium marinum]|uniref:DMP19 family protein n=1 Tax=Ulvibacterium marinum TaxID=2419782 RepID=UPI0024944722|nr:DMP19 family protein [Ulvibacterium marinum]